MVFVMKQVTLNRKELYPGLYMWGRGGGGGGINGSFLVSSQMGLYTYIQACIQSLYTL